MFVRPFPAYRRDIHSNGTVEFHPLDGDYRDAAYDIFCASHGGWIKCMVYSVHEEPPFYSSMYAFTSGGRVSELEGLENDEWYIVDEYHYSGSFRDFDYRRSTKPRPSRAG